MERADVLHGRVSDKLRETSIKKPARAGPRPPRGSLPNFVLCLGLAVAARASAFCVYDCFVCVLSVVACCAWISVAFFFTGTAHSRAVLCVLPFLFVNSC